MDALSIALLVLVLAAAIVAVITLIIRKRNGKSCCGDCAFCTNPCDKKVKKN